MSQPRKSYLRGPITLLALIGFVTLSSGCPRRIVLPDEGRMHRIAREADVTVWCRGPEEKAWTKCDVRAARGWWLVPPSVVGE